MKTLTSIAKWQEVRMKKKLLLTACIVFAAMFSTGMSCVEYELLNPMANLILTAIGLIGMLLTGLVFYIKFCKS